MIYGQESVILNAAACLSRRVQGNRRLPRTGLRDYFGPHRNGKCVEYQRRPMEDKGREVSLRAGLISEHNRVLSVVDFPPRAGTYVHPTMELQLTIGDGVRVTARNKETGDAIQREVAVHPDGQEISASVAKLLVGYDDTLDIPVPGKCHCRLHRYGVADLSQPDGSCARRAPRYRFRVSVVPGGDRLQGQCQPAGPILQLLKKAGQDNADPGNPRASLSAAARMSVEDTRNQLSGMQRSDGALITASPSRNVRRFRPLLTSCVF